MEPLLETFNNVIQQAETIRNLAEQIHQEFFHNEFSSRCFADINSQLIWENKLVLRVRTHCHSSITNPQILDLKT
ncbi:rCG43926 [Rattus norvegicus]|uniref:RCG43926 n=1 Tax=Rattus norvegicus TaxID=10116 RepID=A6J7R0_RAT|nr:rCG43926 [Rattus norvegicus]